MRQLSQHAVRRIAESHDSLRSAFPSDQLVTLQIVSLDIMEGEKALKVKARVVVSDGVSKIHLMFPEKVWSQHEFQPALLDVVSFTPVKSAVQFVKENPVIVMKTPFILVASSVPKVIGSPESITQNLKSGNFPTSYDLKIPPNSNFGSSGRSSKIRPEEERDLSEALNNMNFADDNGPQNLKPQGSNQQKSRDMSYGMQKPTPGSGQQHESKQSVDPYADSYMPIAALNGFCADWCIKARVVKKPPVKNYNNAKGPGQLLNIDLIDREGTMIQATMFNKEVERLADTFEENQVIVLSGGQIKMANKRYTTIKHDFNIMFDSTTSLQVQAEDKFIKSAGFNLTKIQSLQDLQPGSTVDVLGIVMEIGQVGSIIVKATGLEKPKREVKIADESGCMICITLWSEAASKNFSRGDFVVFKSARLGDYGGRSLNASNDTNDIVTNVNDPRVANLMNFYSKKSHEQHLQELPCLTERSGLGGDNQTGGNRNVWYTLKEMVQACEDEYQNEGPFQKAKWFNVKGTVQNILYSDERPFHYLSCLTCRKKLIDENQGYWCESCGKHYEQAAPCYNYSVKFNDFSDMVYASVLGEEIGAALLNGMPCADLIGLEKDEQRAIFSNSQFQDYSFLIKAMTNQNGPNQDGNNFRFNLVRVIEQTEAQDNYNLLNKLEIYKQKLDKY